MDERLLRIMIKSRKITVDKMQSFFQLNKEEMIELLILFLDHDIEFFDSSKPEKNKYLFYTADLIQELYDTFPHNGCRLPFHQRFKILKQELYDLNHICKKAATYCELLSLEEQIYLEIYYYKDIKHIKTILSEDVINRIDDPLLVEGIIISYLKSLRTDEYQYYKEILECLIQNSKSNHNLLFQISYFIEKNLNTIMDDFPKQNYHRLQNTKKLLANIHSKLVIAHRSFEVSSKKRPSVDRPFIFTIDEDSTYIKEDAISIAKKDDNIYVTMYIIDPCDKIFENNELLDEAMHHWFECDNNHLFDMEYAHRYFSLEQGKTRKVIAFEYLFDQNKRMKELNIFEDKIRVNQNFTYDSITELLLKKRNDKPPIPHMKELYDIIGVLHDSNIYKKKYHLLKQLHYYLNNDTKYRHSEDKNGYMIVSELKIATNYALAHLLKDAEIPCVYRNNQFVASEEELAKLEQNCNAEDDADRLYREIQNLNIESWYSNQNEGHYGLHLDCYIHATTPVRNFFSLLNLKIIKDIVIHKQFYKIESYQQFIEELMEKQQSKINRRKKGYQNLIKQKKEMD